MIDESTPPCDRCGCPWRALAMPSRNPGSSIGGIAAVICFMCGETRGFMWLEGYAPADLPQAPITIALAGNPR